MYTGQLIYNVYNIILSNTEALKKIMHIKEM